MGVLVITPPDPVVPLGMAKAHLRVDGEDENTLVAAYVAAATALIDGPSGWLGRSLGPQVLELQEDRFTCAADGLIRIPYGPVIDIVTITYVDAAGVDQVIEADQYILVGAAGVRPIFGATWPAARSFPASVRIRYRAGYAADAEADPLVAAVPAPIMAAILLQAGDLYAFRETAVVGTIAAPINMSTTVENLLGPYRVWTP